MFGFVCDAAWVDVGCRRWGSTCASISLTNISFSTPFSRAILMLPMPLATCATHHTASRLICFSASKPPLRMGLWHGGACACRLPPIHRDGCVFLVMERYAGDLEGMLPSLVAKGALRQVGGGPNRWHAPWHLHNL